MPEASAVGSPEPARAPTEEAPKRPNGGTGAPKKPSRPGNLLAGVVGCVILAGLLMFPVHVNGLTNITENYETYQNGKLPCTTPTISAPCTNAYSTVTIPSGSGGVQVQNVVKEGTQSLQFPAGSSVVLDFATGQLVCATDFSFAVAASSSNINAGIRLSSFAGTGAGDSTHSGTIYSLSFSATTVILSRSSYNHAVLTTTSTNSLTFATAFVANTFYHFTISCPSGAAAGTMAISSPEATALGHAPETATVPANVGADFAGPSHFSMIGGGNNNYFDSLTFGLDFGTPTVGAAATSVNSMVLTGFDSDPMRRIVIARESFGGLSRIDTFDPDTLVLQGVSPLSNACNKVDGVMAWNTQPSDTRGYAGFLDCTVSSTQANFLKIRSNLLGNPDQSNTACTDFCDFDLQTQNGGLVCPGSTTNTLPGGSTVISNIAAVPISWTNGRLANGQPFTPGSTPNSKDSVLLGFAFTDTGNGNVGIWAINQINNVSPDESCGVSVPFGSPSATKQLCTWRSIDGLDYMTAVSDSTSGLTWRTDVSRTDTTSGPDLGTAGQPQVSITQMYPHQSPFNFNVGVACADQYNYVLTTTGTVARIKVLGTSLGMKWQITGAQATERGIAVSRDNLRVAYTSDATHVTIANATTGTILGTVVIPTGTFKEMRLSDAANTLYIATTQKISRYDLAGAAAHINSGNPDGVRGNGTQQCTVDASGVCPTATTTGTGGPGIGSTACLTGFIPTVVGGGVDCGWWFILALVLIVVPPLVVAIFTRSGIATGILLEILSFAMNPLMGFPIQIAILGAIVGAGLLIYGFKTNGGNSGDGSEQ